MQLLREVSVFDCCGNCGCADAVCSAGEMSELEYCRVDVDVSQQQGFISDADLSYQLPALLTARQPVDCVWIIHAPVGFRVRHT